MTLLPLFITTFGAALGGFGFTLLVFILVIGIMIFVHELGHFLVAKSLGVRVDVFSLGFGPRLAGFRRGDTDYRVSALPFGGYVKIAGEQLDEKLTGSPDEFLSRPKWQRFLVAVAGPSMNLLLAFVIGILIFTSGVLVPKYRKEPAIIGGVVKDSAAEKAGLQVGDKIVKINGTSVPTWDDASLMIATNPKRKLTLAIGRGGTTFEREVTPTSITSPDVGFSIGVIPFEPFVLVESVRKDSPAEQAGLRPGDLITKAEHQKKTASSGSEILELIKQNPDVPITLNIQRDRETFSRRIVPVRADDGGRIGIVPGRPTVMEKYGLVASIGKAFEQNRKLAALVFRFLGDVFTGRASLMGPIEIARVSGEAARGGLKPLLQLMLLISLQLGIINLLPIPMLDGGLIFLLAFEGIIRRDLSVAVKEKIVYAGIAFLILVMGVAIVNDLSKLSIFTKLFK